MSRIGKQPVKIPAGIEVTVDGTVIVAKKGNMEKRLETHGRVGVTVENGEVSFSRVDESKQSSQRSNDNIIVAWRRVHHLSYGNAPS